MAPQPANGGIATCPRNRRAAPLLRPGEPQLFLDDLLVKSKRHVARVFHETAKHPANPLIVPDRPWERGHTLIYGDVIREPGGQFRMWYFSVHPKHSKCCCFATSEDGLHWTKPALDLGAPLRRNAVEQPVLWTAQPPPVAKPVQLRFTLSNARLYSYWAGARPKRAPRTGPACPTSQSCPRLQTPSP
ncbi:MAG TPA: hypothetical protein P5137_11520, partial [Candidatus Brocadiia bacterium]|nr:hypothetical protein [Candidatus Brocadiia bacterium]